MAIYHSSHLSLVSVGCIACSVTLVLGQGWGRQSALPFLATFMLTMAPSLSWSCALKRPGEMKLGRGALKLLGSYSFHPWPHPSGLEEAGLGGDAVEGQSHLEEEENLVPSSQTVGASSFKCWVMGNTLYVCVSSRIAGCWVHGQCPQTSFSQPLHAPKQSLVWALPP